MRLFTGLKILFQSNSLTCTSEWSWDAYKERVPTRLYGEQYDWDVENIPDADFTILWDEAVEWYSRQPDPAWSKSDLLLTP